MWNARPLQPARCGATAVAHHRVRADEANSVSASLNAASDATAILGAKSSKEATAAFFDGGVVLPTIRLLATADGFAPPIADGAGWRSPGQMGYLAIGRQTTWLTSA